MGRLADLLMMLNQDELAVVETVARGLIAGRAVYGPLDLATDGRDMASEAAGELRDALVYAAAGLLRLRAVRP